MLPWRRWGTLAVNGSGARGGRRAFLLAGLHLVTLSAFALAQPLFDLLARTPEFFVVRGSTRWDIVALALGVTIGPPALLLAAEAVSRLAGARVWAGTHLVFVAGLAALIALQALKRIPAGPAPVLIGAAALVGAAFALAYTRAPPVRSILTVLAPAPLLFVGLFLLHSPVARITLGSTEVATAAVGHVPGRTPLVVVLLDELPTTSLMDGRGRIDRGRYPNLAALAADSTWFRNATTVHEHSTGAVPSVLTGNYPRAGELPVLADHPRNLFTLLGRSYGYQVFESVTRLCPSELCPRREESFVSRMRWLNSDLSVVYLQLVLPDDLARRLPPVTQTWMNFRGDAGTEVNDPGRFDTDIDVMVGRELAKDQVLLVESFASSLAASRKQTLYLLDVMLPHSPWQYLPSGARYTNGIAIDGLNIDTWWDDEWLVTQGYQRHLLQTAFVDRLLGRVLDRLRATGLYDRSAIVLLADHGVSFRPGDRRRGATPTNLHDIAFVPLFVKEPGQRRGRIVDIHVETIDVLPSIADLLGVAVPWRTDGESFLDPRYRGDPKVRVYRRAGERVVVDEFASLLRRRDATLARQGALFGSGADESRLFAIGPSARELVGRRVDSVPLAPGSGVRIELDQRELLAAVDLESGVVPARITGTVEGEAKGVERPLELAIAVNGRIEAMTQTFELDGTTRFSALVPDAAFRDGANEVEIFSVSDEGGAIGLTPLGGA